MAGNIIFAILYPYKFCFWLSGWFKQVYKTFLMNCVGQTDAYKNWINC